MVLVWIKTLLNKLLIVIRSELFDIYKLLYTDEVILINDLIKNEEDKLSQPSQTRVGIMGNLVLVKVNIN